METVIGPAEERDLPAITGMLSVQLAEHGMARETGDLERAVKGLLDVPSRGAILVARAAARPDSRAPDVSVEREPTIGGAAMSGGEVCGMACLSFLWTLEHAGPAVWLDELYVVPALRGRGIGRALLLAALDRAREHGAAAVDLEVDEDHARAEHLYEREGFTRHRRSRWVRVL